MAAKLAYSTTGLEKHVLSQLRGKGVGFLLGAGTSYLNGDGYPLAFQLWDKLKAEIADSNIRDQIQDTIASGASGIEDALDRLDKGGSGPQIHRDEVVRALLKVFSGLFPPLDQHQRFVQGILQAAHNNITDKSRRIFSLNYDPLIERACEMAKVRLYDGFSGHEHAYFEPAIFDETIGFVSGGRPKERQFRPSTARIYLMKLHGSVTWYEDEHGTARRCAPGQFPATARRPLLVPPQNRKARDSASPPFNQLWAQFYGMLTQRPEKLNRLICLGYGFADDHVNAVLESALLRGDFSLSILTRELNDEIWDYWAQKNSVCIVTETRCWVSGKSLPGHPDLWSFERISREA